MRDRRTAGSANSIEPCPAALAARKMNAQLHRTAGQIPNEVCYGETPRDLLADCRAGLVPAALSRCAYIGAERDVAWMCACSSTDGFVAVQLGFSCSKLVKEPQVFSLRGEKP